MVISQSFPVGRIQALTKIPEIKTLRRSINQWLSCSLLIIKSILYAYQLLWSHLKVVC